MPKVELDTELDVLELADELGISEAIRGNFNGLLAGGEAEVSAILQGAKIIVSEAGTTAAAATAADSRNRRRNFFMGRCCILMT